MYAHILIEQLHYTKRSKFSLAGDQATVQQAYVHALPVHSLLADIHRATFQGKPFCSEYEVFILITG